MLRGQNFEQHVSEYGKRTRGMNYYIDVHDWLGGYPYESVSVRQMDRLMHSLSFNRVLVDSYERGFFPALGLFGTPCTEFVYVMDSASARERT